MTDTHPGWQNYPVFSIRDAVTSDIPAITELYNRLGVATVNSYDLEPVSEANRLEWLQNIWANGHPLLVAEIEGRVVGYAGYFPFKPKAGYSQTVEHSIYLDESAQGQGIGNALMTELINRARQGGIHLIIGLIDSANEQSLRFHESLGFTETGRLPQAGFKFGNYLDVCFLCLLLA